MAGLQHSDKSSLKSLVCTSSRLLSLEKPLWHLGQLGTYCIMKTESCIHHKFPYRRVICTLTLLSITMHMWWATQAMFDTAGIHSHTVLIIKFAFSSWYEDSMPVTDAKEAHLNSLQTNLRNSLPLAERKCISNKRVQREMRNVTGEFRMRGQWWNHACLERRQEGIQYQFRYQ